MVPLGYYSFASFPGSVDSSGSLSSSVLLVPEFYLLVLLVPLTLVVLVVPLVPMVLQILLVPLVYRSC